MKREIMFVMAVVLLAGLVVGCGGASSKYIEAIEAIDTSKAPTLGPVFKDFMLALFTDNAADAWDMLAKDSQKVYEAQYKAINKEEVKKQLEELKKPAEKPEGVELPKETMENMEKMKEMQIKMLETQLEAADAKDYFARTMSAAMKMAMDMEDSKKEEDKKELKIELISEKIDGDKGTIVMKSDGDESDINFVKEDGAWKIIMGK